MTVFGQMMTAVVLILAADFNRMFAGVALVFLITLVMAAIVSGIITVV